MAFPLDNTFEAAKWYAETHGFSVFPTHGVKLITEKKLKACTCGVVACTSPGKHPATNKGRNASSKDAVVIENLWAGRENLNVAISTGIESGIFVIDIDGVMGEESLQALEKKHGKLPKTLTSITGRGKHLIFKYPSKKVFNRTNCLGSSIDVRGDGGYIVAPPSAHISGTDYHWEDDTAIIAEAPQWLLDLVCANSKAPTINEAALNFDESHEWTRDDVAAMLEFIDPNMGYSDWINVGMAINEGGFSFDLWDSWSRTGIKYDGSTAFHWRTFKPGGGITMGTLVEMARGRGWKPKSYITEEKIDWETHPARDWLIEIGAYRQEEFKTEAILTTNKKTPSFPIDPYEDFKEGTIIGETIRWICETAPLPQPVLAMLNTLACLGAIFGRRYASPTNIRTNLFTVGIADTGSGKDHSRKRLKEIMHASGMESYVASDEIKSAPGIGVMLEKTPACVMMLDEFGLVLQSISGDNAPGYKMEISEKLLALFTSSGGSYTFGSYADKRMEPLTLKDPHLCIYGTTTLTTYIKALKRTSIDNGHLNRFVVLPGDEEPTRSFKDTRRGVPDQLLEMWKELLPHGMDLTMMNTSIVQPEITEVGWGEVKEYYNNLCRIQDKKRKEGKTSGTGPLWGRYSEQIVKVAMIFAICRSPIAPSLSMDDMKLAEIIVRASIEYSTDLAFNYMYENENERNKKHIFTIIRNSTDRGVERKDLLKNSNGMRSRDLDDIIKTLLEEERIEAKIDKVVGKAKIRYRSLE